MHNSWIELMVEESVAAMEVLSKVARKYPQLAYHRFITFFLLGRVAVPLQVHPRGRPASGPGGSCNQDPPDTGPA